MLATARLQGSNGLGDPVLSSLRPSRGLDPVDEPLPVERRERLEEAACARFGSKRLPEVVGDGLELRALRSEDDGHGGAGGDVGGTAPRRPELQVVPILDLGQDAADPMPTDRSRDVVPILVAPRGRGVERHQDRHAAALPRLDGRRERLGPAMAVMVPPASICVPLAQIARVTLVKTTMW